jgi:hypothetical protein
MLLQNTPLLENLIVELLSKAAEGLSAQELRDRVATSLRSYSRRGIYKELRRLIDEGVLLRSKTKYSLRLAWVLSLHAELGRLHAQITNPHYLQHALPSKARKLLIRCTDLVTWDRIWTQLMLTMHTALPHLPMFIWCPRHWFTITHPDIENTFTRANEARGHLRYAIVGGRTALDLRDRKILAKKSTAYSFRESPFEYDRNHYYWIIGDYFGVSTLDQRTSQKIEELYKESDKLSNLPSTAGQRLLSQKIRGSLRCEWAPEKAEIMRQTFINFFNLTLKEDGTLSEVKRGEIR